MNSNRSYFNNVKRILLVVLFFNFAVALVKIIYGYWTNSLSLTSDGFHSLFDGTSNVIGIIGITLASRPPDKIHTYGHEKFETLASLGIAILLFITGFEILQSAVGRFYNPEVPEITMLSFIIMGVTIIINVIVSWYENMQGVSLKSNILISDAKHTLSDVYVSVAVIIGFIAIQMGFSIVDPIIAIIIAILIAKMAIDIIKNSSAILLDVTQIDEEKIRKIVNSFPEIKESHRIRSRGTPAHIYVDLHIVLESCYSFNEAHKISHMVESKLKTCIPEIEDVVVHIDPCEDYK